MSTSTKNSGQLRQLKRYPSCKESHVEWIGTIPAHWDKEPLKYVTRFVNGAPFKPQDWGDEGTPIIRIENLNGGRTFNHTTLEVDPRYLVRKGDLLFAWSGNRGTSFGPFLWREEGEYFLNQHIFRVEGFRLHKSWFYWLLKGVTAYVESQAHGIIGLVHITKQDLGAIRVPVVPPDEQVQIGVFLDRETAKIDTLIAKKNRLIELLEEQRTALISHAVTKGVDPTVPMKDSGVEWLGKIPAHWGVIQSRRVFQVRNEPALESDEQLTASQKYGMLPQTEFMEREGRRVVVTIKGVDSLRHVEPNDYVISLRSFQGGIEWCKLSGSVTFHYVVLKPVKPIHPPYFGQLFKSSVFIQALRSTTDFIRDGQDLRYSQFVLVPLPVVPMDEQAAIASFLDRETDRLDRLISKVGDAIDKLREYRTALISAAVTGKIDVREEVA